MMAVLHFLNKRLGLNALIAQTEAISLADLAIYNTVSVLYVVNAVDMAPYENLEAWRAKIKAAIPNYAKANGNGVDKVVQYLKVKNRVVMDS